MEEKHLLNISLILFCIVFLGGIFSVIKKDYNENEVKVGNIYFYYLNKNNPYKKKKIIHYEVLGVSNGYVLYDRYYKESNKIHSFIDSDTIDYFKMKVGE